MFCFWKTWLDPPGWQMCPEHCKVEPWLRTMRKDDTQDRLARARISPDISIRDAVGILDRAGTGIVLACDGEGRLIGVLTDGDIRRALLQGVDFKRPCSEILNTRPLVAPEGISPVDILYLLDHGQNFSLNHLPVVDPQGYLKDLILRRDLIKDKENCLSALIMAGGFGTRLHPLTVDTPKPMLRVGDRPLLERTIDQLKKSGITKINISTYYKPERIVEHFGDGNRYGVSINYLKESEPLGTAGALGLMERPQETTLVINGDILTSLDFQAMLAFHREHCADLTVAVHQYNIEVPFGVLHIKDVNVQSIEEKPSYSFFINAGIYLIEPVAYEYIPKKTHLNMTELMERLIANRKSVVSFPIHEFWLDIGRLSDLEKARNNVEGHAAENPE